MINGGLTTVPAEVIVAALMDGRTQLIVLLLSTPYVRDNGLGSVLAD